MAKTRSIYSCTECGGQQPRWLGRCPDCGEWNSLVEESTSPIPRGSPGPASQGRPKPVPLGDIGSDALPRVSSGVPELDRVLGGGWVPGSVTLLGGEPGIGKSTLALQATAQLDARSVPTLYVSGEESPEQIRMRAERLGEIPAGVQVLGETGAEAILSHWESESPDFVLIDSIQTLQTDRVESAAGSVSQVRETAALLSGVAKRRGTALVLIGHVTKDGSLAGPRVLEHLVDVVLGLEGDREHSFRLLRAQKNRFGSTQEVGVFNMQAEGLSGVANPSELFLAERSAGAPGSCIVPMLEGTRPILVEVQALIATATYGVPRRTCMGIEDGRVALLLAVLDRRSDVDLLSRDVYVNVAGGVRVSEPAADLALCLAVASSRLDVPIPSDVAAFGEVGLGGEVRRVARADLRISEAARLGFRRLLVPAPVPKYAGEEKCELIPISNVSDAVAWLRAST
ncbi:MAG: DNA repair protein RadA [Deltaproteobacteria bacterium]|nr:DNA repair protein RadA [Deltaproteobacteria bacterium]